jgi:Kef-type K+ transport system membrane component KefB
VAGLALAAGAFGSDLYLVVVGMVVITSLLVPPLMPALVRRAEPDAAITGAVSEPPT